MDSLQHGRRLHPECEVPQAVATESGTTQKCGNYFCFSKMCSKTSQNFFQLESSDFLVGIFFCLFRWFKTKDSKSAPKFTKKSIPTDSIL